MKRAFIYRRGGLGDTLLIFPIIEILKKKGYDITASGNRDYLSLARHLGWVDRIVSEKVEEAFDLSIEIGINGNLYPFPQEREWIVDYYLKRLGLQGLSYSKTLPFNEIDPIFKGKVIIHPSSGSRKKNLPPWLFLRLKELYPDGIFVAGEADSWIEEYVNPFYFDNDIIKTASMLRGARLFIGADSGLSHLSAYLGVKTVVIYGPTDPLVWRPVGEDIIPVRSSDCPPCFPHVCEERPCLNERIVEVIAESLRNWIGGECNSC